MNNNLEPTMLLCTKISELRRAAGLTQESLADKLGITFQAVSKWETMASCPDILLLPRLAEIFDVSIDALFGKEKNISPCADLPWEDDNKLRIVMFKGKRYVSKEEYRNEKMDITVALDGTVNDIISEFNVVCEDIRGDLIVDLTNSENAKISVACDTVRSDIVVKIENNQNTSTSLSCDEISGDVIISGSNGTVSCDEICGDVVISGGNCTINCENIEGDVTITENATMNCENITGDVVASCGAKINCEHIEGNLLNSK